jgi:PAS domain S-box-containing protein
MSSPTPWLQHGFDQLEVPLLIVATDRRIAYANPAARRLFGAPPGALEGAGIERLVVNERRGELRNIEDVLKGGSAKRVRSMVRREDGGRLDVTMSVEPCMDAQGRVEGATVRYELIAASGRMSAAPELRGVESRAPAREQYSESRTSPPADSREPPLSGLNSPLPRWSGIRQERSGLDPIASLSPEPSLGRSAPSGVRADSSGPRVPGGVTAELEARLQKVLLQLDWLDARLVQPSSEAPLDDSRERARALMVVAEARNQLQQALEEVKRQTPTVPPLPAPPKLPTL